MNARTPIIRASSEFFNRGVALYIHDSTGLTCVRDVVFEAKDEGEAIPAALRLDNTQAQTLMDDLWNCGVRPTEGAGSAGAMRATERHLDDMRKIVFAKLEIKA